MYRISFCVGEDKGVIKVPTLLIGSVMLHLSEHGGKIVSVVKVA